MLWMEKILWGNIQGVISKHEGTLRGNLVTTLRRWRDKIEGHTSTFSYLKYSISRSVFLVSTWTQWLTSTVLLFGRSDKMKSLSRCWPFEVWNEVSICIREETVFWIITNFMLITSIELNDSADLRDVRNFSNRLKKNRWEDSSLWTMVESRQS